MRDLRSPTAIWIKGGLFVVLGLIAAGLLVAQSPTGKTILLLGLCVWACCRAYFFAFYVIEHYVDPAYRFRGLFSFFCYMCGSQPDTINALKRDASVGDARQED